ncbi:MAG: hypothetical protein FGM46_09090, partial [Ferruginibacter sp.]|nr:hypothetical protein [Ferruginibacter sp.]
MQSLKQSGIHVAEFYMAETGAEIEKYAQILGYPHKKVCIKPAISNGSRGMRILDASAGSLASFFEQKPNNTYTTPENVLQIFKDAKLPAMMVMEYLPGEEYTVDALLDKGEPLSILPRKRTSINNGISTANTDYFQWAISSSSTNMALRTLDARFNGTASFYAAPGVSNQFAWSTNGTTFNLIGSPLIMTNTGSMPTIDLSG